MGIPSVMEDKVLPDYLSRSTIPFGTAGADQRKTFSVVNVSGSSC